MTDPLAQLVALRDDGPLPTLLAPLGSRLPLPPALLVLLAGLPLAVVLGLDPRPGTAAAVATAWAVVAGSLSRGRPHDGRLAWTVPPLLRLLELGVLLRLATGPDLLPASFGLAATLAYHAYDIAHRQPAGTPPLPGWVSALGGGWAIRLPLVVALFALDRPARAVAVLAVLLALLWVGESVTAWARLRLRTPALPAPTRGRDRQVSRT